jgi:hypothetical protein
VGTIVKNKSFARLLGMLILIALISSLGACAQAPDTPQTGMVEHIVVTDLPETFPTDTLIVYPYPQPSPVSYASPYPYPIPIKTYELPPWAVAEIAHKPTPTEPPSPTLRPTPVITPVPVANPPFAPVAADRMQPTYFLVKNGLGLVIIDGNGKILATISESELPGVMQSGIHDWGDISTDGGRIVIAFGEPNPSGRQMLNTSIQIYDLNSKFWKMISDGGGNPVWSPDGSRVAFHKARSLQVYSLEDDSSLTLCHQILENGLFSDIVWSPDSRSLSFMHNLTPLSSSIVTVSLDHPEECQDIIPDEHPIWNTSQKWSPDGQWLLYISMDFALSPEGYYYDNLMIISADGSEKRQLTQKMYINSADWAPDSQHIVFSGGKRYEYPDDYPHDVWITDMHASSLMRLTQEKHVAHACWSKDGTFICFLDQTSKQLNTLSLTTGSLEAIAVEVENFFTNQ